MYHLVGLKRVLPTLCPHSHSHKLTHLHSHKHSQPCSSSLVWWSSSGRPAESDNEVLMSLHCYWSTQISTFVSTRGSILPPCSPFCLYIPIDLTTQTQRCLFLEGFFFPKFCQSEPSISPPWRADTQQRSLPQETWVHFFFSSCRWEGRRKNALADTFRARPPAAPQEVGN